MDEIENMTLDDLEAKIMNSMSDIDVTDPMYLECLKRLKEIKSMKQIEADTGRAYAEEQAAKVEAARAEASKWSWILPTVCQTLGQVAGSTIGQLINRGSVKYVVDAEKEGNIITSRAGSFMTKPR